MPVFFNEQKKMLCASSQQIFSYKVLSRILKWGIFRKRPPKIMRITLVESSRGMSICPSINNKTSIQTSDPGIKRKSLPE